MATFITDVECTDNFFGDCLEILGTPMADEQIILDDIFPRDEVLDCIGEAMEKFYTYFPIIEEITVVGTPIESLVDIPVPNVLGIIHYSQVKSNGGGSSNLMSGNPFFTASQVNIAGSMRRNYGTPFNYYGSSYSTYQEQFYKNSMQNLQGGNQYYCKFDEIKNKLRVKSAGGYPLVVQLGCYSNRTEDIPKTKRNHVIALVQADIGQRFANAMKLMNSDLPLEINADDLLDNCSEMEEQEIEWMQQNSTIPLMR